VRVCVLGELIFDTETREKYVQLAMVGCGNLLSF